MLIALGVICFAFCAGSLAFLRKRYSPPRPAARLSPPRHDVISLALQLLFFLPIVSVADDMVAHGSSPDPPAVKSIARCLGRPLSEGSFEIPSVAIGFGALRLLAFCPRPLAYILPVLPAVPAIIPVIRFEIRGPPCF